MFMKVVMKVKMSLIKNLRNALRGGHYQGVDSSKVAALLEISEECIVDEGPSLPPADLDLSGVLREAVGDGSSGSLGVYGGDGATPVDT